MDELTQTLLVILVTILLVILIFVLVRRNRSKQEKRLAQMALEPGWKL
jgi:preprotein translocase subunit YajC